MELFTVFPTFKVYIKTDENSNIIDINSSRFLSDVTGWIEIDEGNGDKYALAQGNYLDGGICTDEGIYRYRWIDGEVYQKTEQDIAEEMSVIPIVPSLEERVAAAEAALLAFMDMGVM